MQHRRIIIALGLVTIVVCYSIVWNVLETGRNEKKIKESTIHRIRKRETEDFDEVCSSLAYYTAYSEDLGLCFFSNFDSMRRQTGAGDGAKEYCAEFGAGLYTPLTMDYVNFVNDTIFTAQVNYSHFSINSPDTYWIYLKHKEWADRIPPVWTYWGLESAEDAAVTNVQDDHRWYSVQHDEYHHVMCQKLIFCPDSSLATSDDSLCYYMPLGGEHYNWHMSSDFCMRYSANSHMVQPKSRQQTEYILNFLREAGYGNDSFWVNLKKHQGNYTWDYDRSLVKDGWTNWAPDPGSQKAGVAMVNDGKWFTADDKDTEVFALVVCQVAEETSSVEDTTVTAVGVVETSTMVGTSKADYTTITLEDNPSTTSDIRTSTVVGTSEADYSMSSEETVTIETSVSTTQPAVECIPLPTWYNIRCVLKTAETDVVLWYQCKPGFSFDDGAVTKSSRCSSQAGEWVPIIEWCHENLNPASEKQFSQPVEAKNGPILGVMAIVFLIVEASVFMAMDVTHMCGFMHRMKLCKKFVTGRIRRNRQKKRKSFSEIHLISTAKDTQGTCYEMESRDK